MEELEIQIFDEITDYKEKLGIFTFRQWIFAVIIAIVVIPTYIFLPKLVGEDIASYVVLLEAAIIGFIGFVPINNLPAEKIIPYWFRHYWIFNKPVEYMTIAEYKAMKDKKGKNKKPKNIEEKQLKESATNKKTTEVVIKKETQQKNESANVKPISKKPNNQLHKKKLTKEEKTLIKAKKKYGYLFREDKLKEVTDINKNTVQSNLIIEKPIEIEITMDELTETTEPIDNQETQNTNDKIENDIKEQEIPSEMYEINNKLNSLSDEEKKVLLKLLGK